jgi:aminoglycoside phosphotransferase (APT) family kinase protein
MLEERLIGRDGRVFVHHHQLPALLSAAATSIGVLHRASATATTVDVAMFERWVGRPLDQIAALPHVRMRDEAVHATIERLRDELATDLVGRGIVTAYTHGDYWLGNLLVAGSSTPWVVSGIVDWEQAGPGRLAALDIAHLLLTTRACQRHQELGTVVARFLHGETWTPWERDILTQTAATGGELIAPRSLVLVTWLHHIWAGLAKAERHRRASVWVAANVDRVLEAV